MNKPLHLLLTLAVIALLISACDKKRVFDATTAIPEHNWNIHNKISFDIPITDTISKHNIFINLRNGNDYPYANLYLFLTTKLPNKKVIRDTLECKLANDQGKWHGKNISALIDNQILYKKNILFPYAGNYTFEIEQAMRTENLTDVFDVGVRVEKME